MATEDNRVFERTSLCSSAETGEFDLSRRQLTVLRLVDGVTPISIFQEHLKSYDVPVLVNELTELGLIALAEPAQRKTESASEDDNVIRSRHWRTIVEIMLPSLFTSRTEKADKKEEQQRRADLALENLEEFTDGLEDSISDGDYDGEVHTGRTDLNDDSSLSLLSKYAPGLSEDLADALVQKPEIGENK